MAGGSHRTLRTGPSVCALLDASGDGPVLFVGSKMYSGILRAACLHACFSMSSGTSTKLALWWMEG